MMWQEFPANITHVDAVYEHNEVEIVFFIGMASEFCSPKQNYSWRIMRNSYK